MLWSWLQPLWCPRSQGASATGRPIVAPATPCRAGRHRHAGQRAGRRASRSAATGAVPAGTSGCSARPPPRCLLPATKHGKAAGVLTMGMQPFLLVIRRFLVQKIRSSVSQQNAQLPRRISCPSEMSKKSMLPILCTCNSGFVVCKNKFSFKVDQLHGPNGERGMFFSSHAHTHTHAHKER